MKRLFVRERLRDEADTHVVRTGLRRFFCAHVEWEFYDPDDGIVFTGYLERCTDCGVIRQIPQ